MTTSDAPAALEMVDVGRYPLTDPGSEAWREVVSRTRAELREVGCSVLPDFIRPELRAALEAECAELAPQAYTKLESVNAYNIALDAPLPDGHPGRVIMERGNAFVARDQIPATSIIARLYASPVFQRFVADCFSLPELHELADPLAGLTLNVIAPGRAHPWHFDTNEFTVSMLTQEADGPTVEEGGLEPWAPRKLYEQASPASMRRRMAELVEAKGVPNPWSPPADATPEQIAEFEERFARMTVPDEAVPRIRAAARLLNDGEA